MCAVCTDTAAAGGGGGFNPWLPADRYVPGGGGGGGGGAKPMDVSSGAAAAVRQLRNSSSSSSSSSSTMRAELIGPFKPCMNEICLHIDARMADYIHTHP